MNDVEQLGRLLGELAHEIKNPLSTIKVNLKLVDEELADWDETGCDKNSLARSRQKFPRARRKIGVISKEADRLEQILESFLRYADRAKPQLASVDINELMSDMVDFYLPQGNSHSLTIRQQFSAEPLICRADADMLKQAVLNLFINAQQAMTNSGELMVRTAKQDRFAQIIISDTGAGIEADKLGDIFEAYYSSRVGGSGLGLATTRRIVEDHNGRISVASQQGKGTAFTIELPLADKSTQ